MPYPCHYYSALLDQLKISDILFTYTPDLDILKSVIVDLPIQGLLFDFGNLYSIRICRDRGKYMQIAVS